MCERERERVRLRISFPSTRQENDDRWGELTVRFGGKAIRAVDCG
jgi:hypothetical protein